MKKIGVFTSGGDSPGMNAAIRACVRTAINSGVQVFGIYRGYQGLVEGDITELNARSVANIIHRGGTFLKSARSQEFRTPEGMAKAKQNMDKLGIEGLVAIGGDGTFTGAHEFWKQHQVKTIGIPGTIDNDLHGTDYTLGFDTAINTVIEAVDKIRDTALSHDRLFFIEVMGRDSGFIAASAAVASGATAVLIPEKETSIEELIKKIDYGKKSGKKSSIVIVAEGGKSGNAYEIAQKVTEKYDYYNTRVTVLGHVQRGGSPSAFDRILASRLGVEATRALITGRHDEMLGIVNNKVEVTPFSAAITDKLPIDQSLLDLSNELCI
jgi:6-phosphofructokinase 1